MFKSFCTKRDTSHGCELGMLRTEFLRSVMKDNMRLWVGESRYMARSLTVMRRFSGVAKVKDEIGGGGGAVGAVS